MCREITETFLITEEVLIKSTLKQWSLDLWKPDQQQTINVADREPFKLMFRFSVFQQALMVGKQFRLRNVPIDW